MMDRLIAYIEEVRRDRSRAIVVVPNIEAIRNHPSAHMTRLLLVRGLTSSTAHIITRKVQDMLRMRKQSFKISRAEGDPQGFLNVCSLRETLKNSYDAPLYSASKVSIMK